MRSYHPQTNDETYQFCASSGLGQRTCKPSPCSTGIVVYLAMRASISAISLFSRRKYQEPELVRTLHVQDNFVSN